LLQESVFLLKIDTEGFESSVLQGLTALLEEKKVALLFFLVLHQLFAF
jgi:FkbM family methyltransferase